MGQTSKPFAHLDQDWLWISNFQKGERSAFEQIFHKYKASTINLAFRFVKNKEIAEDIAQEVFIKIYEKRVRRDPRAKFTTWLYRVTVNAALDFLRKNKWSTRSLDEGIIDQEGETKTLLDSLADLKFDSPSTSVAAKELAVLVHKEIDRLPQKLRAPILLYQFQELPYAEIARILGITRKAVERRIYHAKEILRAKLPKCL